LLKRFVLLFGKSSSLEEKKEGPALSALEGYLAYYEKLEEPGYAVLVTGEWGTGKSFQVKAAIPEARRYYVSLFGMQSSADIFGAVFAAMNPKLARIKGGAEESKSAAIFGIPVGAIGQQLAKAVISENVEKDRTIIFDDLERSKINVTELLGVINHYVEHHKCRVVVIAHDGKLSEEFKGQKEKVFGREIRVEPNVAAAYDAFSVTLERNLGQDNIAPLIEFKGRILDIRVDSKVSSLRILQHVMEDVVRLNGCLTNEHRENKEAMTELFSAVAALSFECRAERVTRNNMNGTEFREGVSSSQASRYRVDIGTRLLSTQTKVAMLLDGVFDAEVIRSDLNNAIQYVPPDEAPAWKIFIEFHRETDDVVSHAMEQLDSQFRNRELRAPGEILHLLSLRMMMAHLRLIDGTVEETYEDCSKYIDDLLEKGELTPLSLRGDEALTLMSGANGYGFWVEEPVTPYFKSIVEHLKNAQNTAREQLFPQYKEEILELVRTDGAQFRDAVNYSSGGGKFAAVPILLSIEPYEFAEAWFNAHPKNWSSIAAGLGIRLRERNYDGWDRETAWAKEVATNIINQAKGASRLTQVRLLRILRNIPQIAPEESSEYE